MAENGNDEAGPSVIGHQSFEIDKSGSPYLQSPEKEVATTQRFFTWRKICCLSSCCCCLILISLAIAIGVMASGFKMPTYQISSMRFTKLEIGALTLNVYMDIVVTVTNDNVPPIGGSVETVNADIFSLDITAPDKVGVPIKLGTATLASPFELPPKSQAPVTIVVKAQITTSNVLSLIKRFGSDCLLSSAKVTQVRAVPTSIVAKFDKTLYEVPTKTDEMTVDCSSALGGLGGFKLPSLR